MIYKRVSYVYRPTCEVRLKVDDNMYTVWIERTGCTEKRKRKDLGGP